MARAQDSSVSSQPPVSQVVPGVKCLKGKVNLHSLHKANPQRYPFLLESTAQSESNHYSILFAFPGDSLLLDDKLSLLNNDEQLATTDFLAQLDLAWKQHQQHYQSDNDLPFSGGWFLYLGYELAQQVETRLTLPMPDNGFAVACAVRVPAAIIYDHLADETTLVAEGDKLALLEQMLGDINSVKPLDESSDASGSLKVIEEDPGRYIENVARVKQYIVDGDVFQVNLSRRWNAARPASLSALQVYRQLAKTNPAPFSGLMQFPFGSIISSSPERLLSVKDRVAKTRPIAGTRPRSADSDDDQANMDELIGHPKERAEHIMLIDLERNDLGRVCKPGSVEVDELMVLESYAHVHHIVSNVKGELRDDVTPGQAICAVFPGGTITGCPKERCMAIIAELEQEARGAYTGSAGYLNHNGDMDLNILIRTITMTGDEIRIRAGAGLVYDSIAENELEETRHKAKGMLLALGAMS